jgi:hypothetical protein
VFKSVHAYLLGRASFEGELMCIVGREVHAQSDAYVQTHACEALAHMCMNVTRHACSPFPLSCPCSCPSMPAKMVLL